MQVKVKTKEDKILLKQCIQITEKKNKFKMCQNSGSTVQSDQIRKFIEHGMPEKIVKTVQYTLRKREAARNSSTPTKIMATFDHRSETRNAVTVADADTDADLNSSTTHTAQIATQSGIPRLCGRFRSKQAAEQTIKGGFQDKIANIGAAGTEGGDGVGDMDALAITTQMTKHFVQRLYGVAEKMQKSKIYTLLTRTTQPAHLIAVCVLTFVIFTVWPDIIDTRSSNTGQDILDQASTVGKQGIHEHSNLAAIAYLGAFATHFGAQIWMTFVSGLSLYFSLPRHIFGQCQQILFPRYFALSATLSISMLILFVKYFLTAWDTASMVQLTALGVTAFIEVMIRLYLAPPMLRLMHEKYRIEGAVGSGREVGTLEQGDLINCPHYQRIHKTFRRIHMTIAMGNMAVLLATCLHLYFLASKIQIS